MIYIMNLIIYSNHLLPCLLTTLATNINMLVVLTAIIIFMLRKRVDRI